MRVPATPLMMITLTATTIRIKPGAAASLALPAMGKAKVPLVMDSHPPPGEEEDGGGLRPRRRERSPSRESRSRRATG